MTLSAGLRIIGSTNKDRASDSGYMFVLIGQACGGLVQPLILNAPTKLVTRWFPSEERDLFVAISTSFNIIGAMIGQIISPIFVPNNGGFPLLLLVEFFGLVEYWFYLYCFFVTFQKLIHLVQLLNKQKMN
eukprot:UN31638